MGDVHVRATKNKEKGRGTMGDLLDACVFVKPLKTGAANEEEVPVFHQGNTTLSLMRNDGTGDVFVLKTVFAHKPDAYERAVREIGFYQTLWNVDGVLHLADSRITDQRVEMLSEFYPYGDLRKFLMDAGVFRPREALLVIYDAAKVLARLHHEFGIAHRDIKLENFLVRPPSNPRLRCELVLTDFGFSVMTRGLQHSRLGSPHYAPPELWDGIKNAHEHPYDAFKADVWCLGIVFYTMITHSLPFCPTEDAAPSYELARNVRETEKRRTADLMHKIMNKPVSWDFRMSDIPELREYEIPKRIREIVENMLNKDPKKRWSMEQFLTHPLVVASIPEAMRSVPRKPPTPPLDLRTISGTEYAEMGNESGETTPILSPTAVSPMGQGSPREDGFPSSGAGPSSSVEGSRYRKNLSPRTIASLVRAYVEKRKTSRAETSAGDVNVLKDQEETP